MFPLFSLCTLHQWQVDLEFSQTTSRERIRSRCHKARQLVRWEQGGSLPNSASQLGSSPSIAQNLRRQVPTWVHKAEAQRSHSWKLQNMSTIRLVLQQRDPMQRLICFQRGVNQRTMTIRWLYHYIKQPLLSILPIMRNINDVSSLPPSPPLHENWLLSHTIALQELPTASPTFNLWRCYPKYCLHLSQSSTTPDLMDIPKLEKYRISFWAPFRLMKGFPHSHVVVAGGHGLM